MESSIREAEEAAKAAKWNADMQKKKLAFMRNQYNKKASCATANNNSKPALPIRKKTTKRMRVSREEMALRRKGKSYLLSQYKEEEESEDELIDEEEQKALDDFIVPDDQYNEEDDYYEEKTPQDDKDEEYKVEDDENDLIFEVKHLKANLREQKMKTKLAKEELKRLQEDFNQMKKDVKALLYNIDDKKHIINEKINENEKLRRRIRDLEKENHCLTEQLIAREEEEEGDEEEKEEHAREISECVGVPVQEARTYCAPRKEVVMPGSKEWFNKFYKGCDYESYREAQEEGGEEEEEQSSQEY